MGEFTTHEFQTGFGKYVKTKKIVERKGKPFLICENEETALQIEKKLDNGFTFVTDGSKHYLYVNNSDSEKQDNNVGLTSGELREFNMFEEGIVYAEEWWQSRFGFDDACSVGYYFIDNKSEEIELGFGSEGQKAAEKLKGELHSVSAPGQRGE